MKQFLDKECLTDTHDNIYRSVIWYVLNEYSSLQEYGPFLSEVISKRLIKRIVENADLISKQHLEYIKVNSIDKNIEIIKFPDNIQESHEILFETYEIK